MLHRKPPKPIWYDNYVPGQCRFCGEPVLNKAGKINTRANWHSPGCVAAYKVMYWPAETRKAVWKRDHGQCAHCPTHFGSISGDWQVDHVKPLIEAKGDLDYWRMDNLETLCRECHTRKTSREATERAERRRAEIARLSRESAPPET